MLFIHFLLLLPVAIVGAPNEHIDNSLPDSKTPVKDVIHNHNSADSSDKSGKDERQFHAEDVTESESRRVKRNALRDRSKRWPKGRVPYTIANNFTDQQLAEIMEGMQQFAKVSCIRFEPKRDDDVDYVYIYPLTTVCGSKIGRVGGEQALVLSPRCSNKRTILHEMMHAIGFHHEHNRADRDDYVDIYERFIQPGAEDEFKKRTLDEIDHLGMEYDYSSIMHYGKRTFAAGRWPPMWPKKNGVEIGNKQEFSETDIKKINIYYECPQEGETTTTRESEPTTTTTEKLPTEGETTTTGESGSTTTKTTTTTTTKQPPTGCADVADFCHSVRLFGVCHLRAAYTYCQKTCERCNEAPPHTPEPDPEAPPHTPEPDPACVDEVPYCERYFHICGEFPDDLGPKCKKTCELCGKQKRHIMINIVRTEEAVESVHPREELNIEDSSEERISSGIMEEWASAAKEMMF
ncbi:Zinc metalloproteinase nas-13 [Toxocara canis]|uniref:Metalloendopeptidase n=1 Tax=Toxocara canis TaxID=6265 RepID=A0A0B2VUN5_TOXCA|nr:Zinc metalloproteinase nas-13 [Toxocara canis]